MQTKIEKIDSQSVLVLKNIQDQPMDQLDFLSFREKLSYANISHKKNGKNGHLPEWL